MADRLKRNQRAATPPAMCLTERDVDIVQAVADYRILRQDQLQSLFFSSRSTAQYRLSLLYQHGFLARQFQPVAVGWSPTLYTLDKRGVALLKAERGIDGQLWTTAVGHEFLAHTLAINDVRVSVTLACRTSGIQVANWQTEHDLKAVYDRVSIRDAQGKVMSVSLIPDSYFVLETSRGRAAFCLEMDMGTMTLSRFQTKVRAYQAFVASGQYTRRYQTRSLRVLTVASSQQRALNLKRATEQAEGDRLFWFASKDAVTADTALHTALWHVAGSPTLMPLIPATS